MSPYCVAIVEDDEGIAQAMANILHVVIGDYVEIQMYTRVADLPEGVKQPVEASRILNAGETRALYGDGVFGGPYSADEALMQRIFDAAVADIVEKLRFE